METAVMDNNIPSGTASLPGVVESSPYDPCQVTVLPQNSFLLTLMTILRDSETSSKLFSETVEKVADQLMGAALSLVPAERVEVTSPTGVSHQGFRHTKNVCGISILRAGAALENALRKAYTGPLSFGKILIQRDEATTLPSLLYYKFPPTIESDVVLVLEPMLATGGSASCALDLIKSVGVPEERIIFINVLASRCGIDKILGRFPRIHLVTMAVDEELSASKQISPGLGDFGDRFYGTIG